MSCPFNGVLRASHARSSSLKSQYKSSNPPTHTTMHTNTPMASHHQKKYRKILFTRLHIPILLCFCTQFSYASDVETALQIVRTWVNGGMVVSDGSNATLEKISGVCVVLRKNGDILGYGEAFGEKESELSILEDAATIAFSKAKKHPIIRSLPEDVRSFAFATIGIEVGIATEYTPIPTKDLDKAAKQIVRGVDGIATRRGNTWDFRFPSHMRLSPFRRTVNHLEGMCIKVGAPAAEVIAHQLPVSEDITIYKVSYVSAYQKANGESIRVLFRGDDLITLKDLQQAGLQHVANLLASHVMRSVWPLEDPIGITGTYLPEVDRLDVVFAPTISQAMAAEALWNYAQIPSCNQKEKAIVAYTRIMNDLAVVNEHESPITGVTEQSFVVLASSGESLLSKDAVAMIQNCKERVIDAATKLVAGTHVPSKTLDRGVLSAAIAMIAKQDGALLALAQQTIEITFATTQQQSSASLIPWIIHASVTVVDLGGTVDAAAIRELRAVALSSQVINDSVPDLIGGFSLQTKTGSVTDARGIRMLPMLAYLLPVETFTPRAERSAALRSLLLAARYTAQLTTSVERASRFANPAKATGGVRASVWDATMKPEATAMALIGITEAIQTLNRVAQGQ